MLLVLYSCSENDDRNAVNRNLRGTWKITEAERDEWGNGAGGKTPHAYLDKSITFSEDGTWKLSDTVDGSVNGRYKVQPESRGDYVIHMDCLTPEGKPARKEYWDVSFGRGDRLRVSFEQLGGWVDMKLEKE